MLTTPGEGGDNPGGGNNGTGNQKEQGLIFWTTNPNHVGVSVYIDGLFAGTFTKYVRYVDNLNGNDPNSVFIPGNLPDCGTPGQITVSRLPGKYRYTTTNGISGDVTIIQYRDNYVGGNFVRMHP